MYRTAHLCAKLTSSINYLYLLYWLRSSVSHILLKNSWRSNALAFSTGKSATQAILLMKMSGRLDHTGLVSPFSFWRASDSTARQNVRSALLDSWCGTMHVLHTASEQNLSGSMRSLFSERSNWKQPNQQPSCQSLYRRRIFELQCKKLKPIHNVVLTCMLASCLLSVESLGSGRPIGHWSAEKDSEIFAWLFV